MAVVTVKINQGTTTWTVPSDFGYLVSIECIGAGGSGAAGSGQGSGSGVCTGAGGGEYRKSLGSDLTGLTFSIGTVFNVQVGQGGTAQTRTGTGVSNGNDGTATWFGNASPSTSTGVLANPGLHGLSNTGTTTTAGGSGGSGGVGTTGFNGGNGGSNTSNGRVATGGGGAGGTTAGGSNGVNAAANNTSTNGGAGGTASGGTAGTSGGGAGGNGTVFGGSDGAGGGGGGNEATSGTLTAGSGGQWGGGGGAVICGSSANTQTSGAGKNGIMIITYVQTVLVQGQDFLIPHPRPERAAALLLGDTGIAAPFVAPVMTFNLWDDAPQTARARMPRAGALRQRGDDVVRPFVLWQNDGWEVPSPQPPHPFWERRALSIRSDDGTAAPYFRWVNGGWEVQMPQPPHPRPERSASWLRGDDGTQAAFSNWFPYGWPVQPVQPNHPRPERAGAWMRWEDGTEAAFIPPTALKNMSWDTLFDPQYRVRRWPALIKGDDGNAAPFIVWRNFGWEVQPPPPRKPTPRAGSYRLRGDEGATSPFIVWRNAGWEIQAHQPRHPRPERAAAGMIGDPGNEAVFIFAPTVMPVTSWDVRLDPPYRVRRLPAMLRGDDGTAARFLLWRNAGWEQAPSVWRSWRRAPFTGDDGIVAPLIIAPSVVRWGWDAQDVWRIPRRAVPPMFDLPLVATTAPVPFIQGWEAFWIQPPHPPTRAAIFHDVELFVPLVVPPRPPKPDVKCIVFGRGYLPVVFGRAICGSDNCGCQ